MSLYTDSKTSQWMADESNTTPEERKLYNFITNTFPEETLVYYDKINKDTVYNEDMLVLLAVVAKLFGSSKQVIADLDEAFDISTLSDPEASDSQKNLLLLLTDKLGFDFLEGETKEELIEDAQNKIKYIRDYQEVLQYKGSLTALEILMNIFSGYTYKWNYKNYSISRPESDEYVETDIGGNWQNGIDFLNQNYPSEDYPIGYKFVIYDPVVQEYFLYQRATIEVTVKETDVEIDDKTIRQVNIRIDDTTNSLVSTTHPYARLVDGENLAGVDKGSFIYKLVMSVKPAGVTINMVVNFVLNIFASSPEVLNFESRNEQFTLSEITYKIEGATLGAWEFRSSSSSRPDSDEYVGVDIQDNWQNGIDYLNQNYSADDYPIGTTFVIGDLSTLDFFLYQRVDTSVVGDIETTVRAHQFEVKEPTPPPEPIVNSHIDIQYFTEYSPTLPRLITTNTVFTPQYRQAPVATVNFIAQGNDTVSILLAAEEDGRGIIKEADIPTPLTTPTNRFFDGWELPEGIVVGPSGGYIIESFENDTTYEIVAQFKLNTALKRPAITQTPTANHLGFTSTQMNYSFRFKNTNNTYVNWFVYKGSKTPSNLRQSSSLAVNGEFTFNDIINSTERYEGNYYIVFKSDGYLDSEYYVAPATWTFKGAPVNPSLDMDVRIIPFDETLMGGTGSTAFSVIDLNNHNRGSWGWHYPYEVSQPEADTSVVLNHPQQTYYTGVISNYSFWLTVRDRTQTPEKVGTRELTPYVVHGAKPGIAGFLSDDITIENVVYKSWFGDYIIEVDIKPRSGYDTPRLVFVEAEYKLWHQFNYRKATGWAYVTPNRKTVTLLDTHRFSTSFPDNIRIKTQVIDLDMTSWLNEQTHTNVPVTKQLT